MASKNKEDFRKFDWDDSALIKAYNKGTKLREKGLQKSKNSNKGGLSKENMKTEVQWKVGDHCRAMYSADKLLYEAKIHSIKHGCATVEFLGYGDKETVDLQDLKESAGKAARKRQIKFVLVGYSAYSTASESCLNSTDGKSESHESCSAMKKLNESRVTTHAPYDYTTAESTYQLPHSHAAVNHSHAATCYAPPTVPSNMPFLPAPPAPPMPQCPSVAQNPSLSAMLVSWYMAGYYTGLHQGQKGSQCSQYCCGHANRCCH